MIPERDGAYSGRWVARLRGKIVAQGGTPEQARLAALSRFKETPEIVFMPDPFLFCYPSILEKIMKVLPPDLEIFLVGGAVRDMLLNREVHDLDFTQVSGGITTARAVANALKADFFPLDPERDTGRVILKESDGSRHILDFASFRGPNLDGDLVGRDFTLNTIALELHTCQVFDPLGGGMDIKERKLRACSATSIPDDPVRILRAIRLAADLGFRILTETRQAMKTHASKLADVSPERVRDELFRILEGVHSATCLRALDMLGALDVILPELSSMKGVAQPAPHQHDVWSHVLAMCSYLESILGLLTPGNMSGEAEDLINSLLIMRIGRYRQQLADHLNTPLAGERRLKGLLFLAALYHDVAKPATMKLDEHGQLRFWEHDQQGAEIAAKRARLLALSNDEITRLETIIRNHMRFLFLVNRLVTEGKPPSRRAIYRFFRDSGQAGVDLTLLGLADLRAIYLETLPQETWVAALDVAHLFLENWYEKPTESITPPPLVDGNDLMQACNLDPGPRIGELLEAIREAQAMGEVTTRDQALALARKKLN
jgi:tRNA nucleotidyltransferase/poly(A) polymerase